MSLVCLRQAAAAGFDCYGMRMRICIWPHVANYQQWLSVGRAGCLTGLNVEQPPHASEKNTHAHKKITQDYNLQFVIAALLMVFHLGYSTFATEFFSYKIINWTSKALWSSILMIYNVYSLKIKFFVYFSKHFSNEINQNESLEFFIGVFSNFLIFNRYKLNRAGNSIDS